MLKLSAIFTLALFVSSVRAVTNPREIARNFIEKKCLKNGGEDAFPRLMNATEEALDYFYLKGKNIIREPADADEAIQILCTEVLPIVHPCFDILFDALQPCLDEEEVYLPNFIHSWFNYTYDAHCSDTGKEIKEHFELYMRASCKRKDPEDDTDKCFGGIAVVKHLEDPNFVIPKSALCGYLEPANECVLDMLKKHCNEEWFHFIEDHLKPTKTWCDTYVNNAVDN